MRTWLLLLTVLAAACDPIEPSATGEITLGAGVAERGYSELEIRMFPDPGPRYDPTAPVPTLELREARASLADISFPYDYWIGAGAGTNPDPAWRVVAWLTTAPRAAAEGPVSGDTWGTRTFTIPECGLGFEGYCGNADGMDFTIDQLLP